MSQIGPLHPPRAPTTRRIPPFPRIPSSLVSSTGRTESEHSLFRYLAVYAAGGGKRNMANFVRQVSRARALAAHPIPLLRRRPSLRSRKRARVVSGTNPESHWHRWQMSSSDFRTSDVHIFLSSDGADINVGNSRFFICRSEPLYFPLPLRAILTRLMDWARVQVGVCARRVGPEGDYVVERRVAVQAGSRVVQGTLLGQQTGEEAPMVHVCTVDRDGWHDTTFHVQLLSSPSILPHWRGEYFCSLSLRPVSCHS